MSIKKLTTAFITSSLATTVYAGAFSEERKFEIIGYLQQMVHDTHGFKVNHQRNMTPKCLPAKISTHINAYLITLSDEKSGTMLLI